MTSQRPGKPAAPFHRIDRPRSAPALHSNARRGGLRVSARRHLRTEAGRPAPDPIRRKVASGRAIAAAGLALIAAALVLFAVALVVSRLFGR